MNIIDFYFMYNYISFFTMWLFSYGIFIFHIFLYFIYVEKINQEDYDICI